MAVEVVGESADKKLRVDCGNCSAELEYVRTDIQSKTVEPEGHPFGMSWTEHFVLCPRCGTEVAAAQ